MKKPGESRCSVCNRPLKDPKSIALGIGPVCATKGQKGGGQARSVRGGLPASDLFLTSLPLAGGIIIDQIDPEGLRTNVPHRVSYYTSGPEEWACTRAGGMDLSLNIVEAVLLELGYDGERTEIDPGKICFVASARLYEAFHRDWLSKVKRLPESVLPFKGIRNWILQRMVCLSKGYTKG